MLIFDSISVDHNYPNNPYFTYIFCGALLSESELFIFAISPEKKNSLLSIDFLMEATVKLIIRREIFLKPKQDSKKEETRCHLGCSFVTLVFALN